MKSPRELVSEFLYGDPKAYESKALMWNKPAHLVSAADVEELVRSWSVRGRRVKHKKTGGTYHVLEEAAEMQTSVPVGDYEVVTIYQGKDGRVWVRPRPEFNDGRFEPAE